jgi:hypothetical protein
MWHNTAHTAFAYGSYFWWQDTTAEFLNGKYADTAFVMAMLEMHWGTPVSRLVTIQRTCLCNGTLQSGKTGRCMSPANVCCSTPNGKHEGEVLDAVNANPLTSTHWVTSKTGLSWNADCQVDIKFCLQFCYWLLHKNIDEYDVTCHVLWTDKATFTRSGVNNFHCLH